MTKKRLAIVGTGIAGLGCAHFLNDTYDLTLFEKNSYIGGHTNTIIVQEENGSLAIDTGFMVYNPVNYPNLLKLFTELNIQGHPTDMSFSLNSRGDKLAWSGASFKRLFCDMKNLGNVRYWKMLLQLNRFNQDALTAIESGEYDDDTLADYIRKRGYGNDLLYWYLIPISSAIWSTPAEPMQDFPAITLLRFFHNHGFLGQTTQHQWYTVPGGSRAYVEKLIVPFQSKIRLEAGVRQIIPNNSDSSDAVSVILNDGTSHGFDAVILASHADESLAMLSNPTPNQERLLSAFSYQQNRATLHTDVTVMPGCKPCWASWNYRVEKDGSASTHYWMNSLQNLQSQRQYFVSINGQELLNPDHVIREITYHHPIFSREAVKAQAEIFQLNQNGPIYFCGSYFKYGFHEDAFTSALSLCRLLLQDDGLWR
jgi:predicted NAD/FAD-binding protein